MSDRDRGFTLIEVIVVIVIVAILAAFFLGTPHCSIPRAQLTQCGNNLRQAYTAMRAITVNQTMHPGEWPIPGGAMKDGSPVPRGAAWWTIILTTGEVDDRSLLWCPINGRCMEGQSDFWGPLSDPNDFNAAGPIGMDAVGNHEEDDPLNVIMKGGDLQQLVVTELDEQCPEWRSILGP